MCLISCDIGWCLTKREAHGWILLRPVDLDFLINENFERWLVAWS